MWFAVPDTIAEGQCPSRQVATLPFMPPAIYRTNLLTSPISRTCSHEMAEKPRLLAQIMVVNDMAW
ncbi:hypothetical protein WM40_16250 [Robbsia andropogonis]|uniref:Uncharacterized protein n=1 Tax=Robbsia andropogonis TaxID=28092 RepID=A0A0F5JXP2_9BURK|nr:hypothetical protein WM40_16250 [Robbsia andropogonis]